VSSPSAGSSTVSLRAVALVAAASFGQLLLLLWLQRVQARVFGASEAMDAYLCASTIPLVLGGILAAAAGTAIVPFYHECRQVRGIAPAEATARRVAFWLLLLATGLALLLQVTAAPVVTGVFRDLSPSTSALTQRLMAVLCWLVPLNVLTGFFFGLCHARRQFLWPAVSGLLGPALTLAIIGLANSPTTDDLAWSVIVGGLAGGLVLLPIGLFSREAVSASLAAPGKGEIPPPLVSGRGAGENGDGGHSSFRASRFVALALPILLGAAYSRLDLLVDRFLASRLPDGTISHMGYASRIVTAVATLATSGLSIVIFPALAQHAAAADYRQLRKDLSEGWRFLTVLLVPVLLGIGLCGRSIISALLERGAFQPADSEAVNRLLLLSFGILVGASVGEVASKGVTALRRPWLGTTIGIVGFSLATLAKISLVDRWGADGLVSLTSVMFLGNATLLFLCLRYLAGHRGTGPDATGRDVSGEGGGRFLSTLLRTAVAGVPAVLLARLVMWDDSLPLAAAGIAVAILTYAALLLALREEFAVRAWTALSGLVVGKWPSRSAR
jgi:putative peptidoglycan lipid II flippase